MDGAIGSPRFVERCLGLYDNSPPPICTLRLFLYRTGGFVAALRRLLKRRGLPSSVNGSRLRFLSAPFFLGGGNVVMTGDGLTVGLPACLLPLRMANALG